MLHDHNVSVHLVSPRYTMVGGGEEAPWALVELDANREGATPVLLQFLGRQRFTKSRKPFIKPAGFTPRGRSDQAVQEDKGEKDELRPPFSFPGGNTLQRAVDPPRLALPALAAHAAGGVDIADAPPSQRGRVLPVKPSQRQPSPRVALPRGAGPAVQGLGLVVVDDSSAWGAARSAAFTPRSQALEDAKAAQRRNMANGCMKKLMCVSPPRVLQVGLPFCPPVSASHIPTLSRVARFPLQLRGEVYSG